MIQEKVVMRKWKVNTMNSLELYLMPSDKCLLRKKSQNLPAGRQATYWIPLSLDHDCHELIEVILNI